MDEERLKREFRDELAAKLTKEELDSLEDFHVIEDVKSHVAITDDLLSNAGEASDVLGGVAGAFVGGAFEAEPRNEHYLR